MSESKLQGRHIAIPETRQLDVLAGLLERRGAQVLRCPLVGIHDTSNVEQVHAWLDTYIRMPFDDLILLTGEGLRRLLGFAERYGVREAFVAAMAQSRILVRGPKPAKALREIGLNAALLAEPATTAGVIQTLRNEKLYDRRIGVQLYGEEPNVPLRHFLDQAGAHDFFVAPYIYADEAEDVQVSALIVQICEGSLDAICFTSSPQWRRLSSLAKKSGHESALFKGLAGMTVAAVGPVIAETLTLAGVRVDLMPSESWFMKPLVQALMDHWG
jgi:uroporphyrinogen-III synthase